MNSLKNKYDSESSNEDGQIDMSCFFVEPHIKVVRFTIQSHKDLLCNNA